MAESNVRLAASGHDAIRAVAVTDVRLSAAIDGDWSDAHAVWRWPG